MPPRQKRYKLLLDEMLPRRIKYPQLNKFHDVKHLVHDYKQSGLADSQVLHLAQRLQRILVTKNIKDFEPRCRDFKVDVIGVTETISPEELDKSLMAKLRHWGKSSMSGRFTKIIRSPRKNP